MAENTQTDNFEQFLLSNKLLSREDFDRLKQESEKKGKPVAALIEEQKILDAQTLAKARAAFLNIPYVSFEQIKVAPELVDLIPSDTVNFYKLFAFEKNGKSLKVAMVDPTDIRALEALEFFSKKQGLSLELYATDQANFDRVVHPSGNVIKLVGEALANIEQTEKQEQAKKQNDSQQNAQVQQLIQEDAPISKIVDVIMTNAINGNASDIHIEPEDNLVRVRYRVDGILHNALELPKSVQSAVISKIKILSNLKIDESRLPQDGRFHFETDQKKVDLRVSILPNVNGEKIVMRILDKSTKVPTLEQLGFRGKSLQWTLDNIKKTHGIFLITGPTGSGKSTTLYSLLSMLNTTEVNIITLEDPVEYFMDGVNQTQINPDIGLTFASGLRSILRQDPNIIMVGEIRDKETAELAVQAALTGHLVFSTLHTNDAIGALPRLMDMEIEPFLLVASINVVAAQRLTRKICPDCKKEIPIPAEVKKKFEQELANVNKEEIGDIDMKNMKMYAGAGCDKCGKTGYKGRIAIVEVIEINKKMQDMVLAKALPADILAEAQKMGMVTMEQDGIIKVLQGITTYEEVVRVTTE